MILTITLTTPTLKQLNHYITITLHHPDAEMPTQRPFFSNFLAAFRAHSALKASATTASASTSTNAASISTHASHLSSSSPSAQVTASTARQISTATKTAPGTTLASASAAAAVTAAFSPPRHTTTSNGLPTARSPTAPLASQQGTFGDRRRRGSDSSSEGGFRDALGGEKWFIGGRTAAGEERFYRLGMVRRERSGDRASCDRMSL